MAEEALAQARGKPPSLGARLVCPPFGIGVVVEAREGPDGDALLVLEIAGCGLRLAAPERRLVAMHLRPLVSLAEARRAMRVLAEPPVRCDPRHYRKHLCDLEGRLARGVLLETAAVWRDLWHEGRRRALSMSAMRLLDLARNLVASELALVLRRDPERLVREVEGAELVTRRGA